MDSVEHAQVKAAIRLATAQDELAASLRNCQMVNLSPEEMGRVTGLTAAEIRTLLNRWGLDT